VLVRLRKRRMSAEITRDRAYRSLVNESISRPPRRRSKAKSRPSSPARSTTPGLLGSRAPACSKAVHPSISRAANWDQRSNMPDQRFPEASHGPGFASQTAPAGPNAHRSPELAPQHAATHNDVPLGRSPGSRRARNRCSVRPLESRIGRAGVHGSGHCRCWIRIGTRRADMASATPSQCTFPSPSDWSRDRWYPLTG
jgi:hypothetical protein